MCAVKAALLRAVLYACVKRHWCVYAAGGGGEEEAEDADARAFGVCNQHRWTDCQMSELIGLVCLPLRFRCGFRRGTLKQMCFGDADDKGI